MNLQTIADKYNGEIVACGVIANVLGKRVYLIYNNVPTDVLMQLEAGMSQTTYPIEKKGLKLPKSPKKPPEDVTSMLPVIDELLGD